ncbi:MAG: putative metal-binding motif-containing protein [Deltaproteobacteria bacterium]|nr:putative metal-binding motif-containing protein [Deltaproteobacteria bacterium]
MRLVGTVLAMALATAFVACTAASTSGTAEDAAPEQAGTDDPGDATAPDPDPADAAPEVAEAQPDAGAEAETGPEAIDPDAYPDGICPGCAGHACANSGDCFSGACVETMHGSVCSETCSGEGTCPEGWICAPFAGAGDPMNVCLDPFSLLCRPCRADADCLPAVGAAPGKYACVDHGAKGRFCGAPCGKDEDCPEEWSCEERDGTAGKTKQCVPSWGQGCKCTEKYEKAGYTTTCWVQNALGRCEGERTCADDCDAGIPVDETCNGKDDNCDGKTDEKVPEKSCTRKNGFGSCKGQTACVGGEERCDAPEPAAEVCGGLDDDCDGDVNDEDAVGCTPFHEDQDGDGHGAADGPTRCLCVAEAPWTATVGGDCNDGDAALNPGATEACNGRDDDCDGATDPDGSQGCKACWPDADGDGYGGAATTACVCATGELPAGCAAKGGDCRDDDPAVHPGAAEVCNGRDDDCDQASDPEGAGGCVPWYQDGDGDGYGMSGVAKCLCDATGLFRATRGGDCDDGDNEVHPQATEKCNGKDDDCVGGKDGENAAGCAVRFADGDSDGWGLATDSRCLCAPTGAYTAGKSGDCDDADNGVNPGAKESCNGKDDDCTGGADPEGTAGCTELWLDNDGDGFGDPTSHKCLCGPTGAWKVANDKDCCDKDAAAKPGQTQFASATNACGSWDYNCDGNAQKEKTGMGSCDFLTCSKNEGWADAVPECGVTAAWLNGCTWILGFCDKKKDNRMQRCL